MLFGAYINQLTTQLNIFIGDFNMNYLVDNTLKSLFIIFLLDMISTGNWYTTDYGTVIDYICTNSSVVST